MIIRDILGLSAALIVGTFVASRFVEVPVEGVVFVGGLLLFATVGDALLSRTEWHKTKQANKAEAERVAKIEADKKRLAKEWDKYVEPTADEFLDKITALYRHYCRPLILREAQERALCTALRKIFGSFGPQGDIMPDDYARALGMAQHCFTNSLKDFTNALGRPIVDEVVEFSWQKKETLFYVTTRSSTYAYTDDGKATQRLLKAYEALAAPLKTRDMDYKSLGVSQLDYGPSLASAPTLQKTKEDAEFYVQYHEDATVADVKWIKSRHDKERAAAQKINDAAYKALSPVQNIFLHTPYWKYIDDLYPNFEIKEPIVIPPDTRFAGTWIIAPSGRGKTNLLHNMIAEDRASNATVVLMDSKSDFYNTYSGLRDVVVIDPATVEINPFQIASATLTTEFLEYIFSALLETEMTPFQSTLFSAVLALVIRIPNATVETFREILLSGWKPYEKYLKQLDKIDRDFFTAPNPEFDQKNYKERRNELIWRLRSLLKNAYLRRIFTSPKSNVDFYKLLDSGKTIIIDNAVAQLGATGAEFFGRFFVAIIWMAAISRANLKSGQKVPVYFYIDEAQTVISRDEKIPVILDECRSQKIALILSHQRITRIASANVMDALTNCAIKIGNADDDAAALAKRFRVDAKALDLPKGVFCLYVRDTTPTAVTIDKLPLFDLSAFPPPLPRKPPPPPQDDEPGSEPPPEQPNAEATPKENTDERETF